MRAGQFNISRCFAEDMAQNMELVVITISRKKHVPLGMPNLFSTFAGRRWPTRPGFVACVEGANVSIISFPIVSILLGSLHPYPELVCPRVP